MLYNLALDVYPIYMDSKDFVVRQKRETFNDLVHALRVMRYIDDQTPKARVFFFLYLLETRQLSCPANVHVNFNY